MRLACVLFTALFVALKIHHNIDWSWWAVFTPAMILGAFTAFGLAVAAVVAVKATKHIKSVAADLMKGGPLF